MIYRLDLIKLAGIFSIIIKLINFKVVFVKIRIKICVKSHRITFSKANSIHIRILTHTNL